MQLFCASAARRISRIAGAFSVRSSRFRDRARQGVAIRLRLWNRVQAIAFYRFIITYEPPEWSRLADQPGHLLASVTTELERAGPGLLLFWPAEESHEALIVSEVSEPAATEVASALGVAAGGSLARSESVDVSLPETGITIDERSLRVVTMAFPQRGWRCKGCGEPKPPHHKGCAYDLRSETVA